MSVAEAAEQINAKMEIITDLDADDFSRMPAAIYAKGFIRLYAECVNLNPAPLIEQYNRANVPNRVQPPPVRMSVFKKVKPPAAAPIRTPEAGGGAREAVAGAPAKAGPKAWGFPERTTTVLLEKINSLRDRLPATLPAPPRGVWKIVGACAAALVLVFAGTSAWRFFAGRRIARVSAELRFIEPPPQPYIAFEPPSP